ncbi:MAG: hypothetical protein FWD35_02345, partial [Oscillospiraceae bacterium]|nr:hypothetical protein [Oscillospiraceae bacterium]
LNLRDFCPNSDCLLRWHECPCDHVSGIVCEVCGELEGFIVIHGVPYCLQRQALFINHTAGHYLSDADIADIARMSNLVNLTLRSLSNVTDLTPLAALTDLQQLFIGHQGIMPSELIEQIKALWEALPGATVIWRDYT